MDNIKTIREILTPKFHFKDGTGPIWKDAEEMSKAIQDALAALDRATIKVTDEEIERLSTPERWEGQDMIVGGMTLGLMIHEHDRLEAKRITRTVLKFARDHWLKTSPWISVDTKMPEGQEIVIGIGDLWTRSAMVFFGDSTNYSRDEEDPIELPMEAEVMCWRWEDDGIPVANNNVTHWMPLPLTP